MKKQEFIRESAIKAWLTQDTTAKLLGAMIEIITEELKKGKEVTITGFGTFGISVRGARKGRNPATGEIIELKESKSPKFKVGKTLKDAIKNA